MVGPWWRRVLFFYKEEMAAHLDMLWFRVSDLGLQACIPGLFSRVMVPSGTRVFLVGNPYLFLKEV